MKPKLVILDVDGVLTNGTKIYENGIPVAKSFHDHDFTAIKLLKLFDIKVCFMTADPLNIELAKKRKITHFLSRDSRDRIDKAALLSEVSAFYQNIDLRADAWIVGDDFFDVPAFSLCAASFAPADAPEYVKKNATHVLHTKGGEGIVMELVEMLNFKITPVTLDNLIELDKDEH